MALKAPYYYYYYYYYYYHYYYYYYYYYYYHYHYYTIMFSVLLIASHTLLEPGSILGPEVSPGSFIFDGQKPSQYVGHS